MLIDIFFYIKVFIIVVNSANDIIQMKSQNIRLASGSLDLSSDSVCKSIYK